MCVRLHKCVEAKGQLVGISSLLLPYGPKHQARTVRLTASACPAEPSHLSRSQKLWFRKPGSARVHSVSPSSQCVLCHPSLPECLSLSWGSPRAVFEHRARIPWGGLEFQPALLPSCDPVKFIPLKSHCGPVPLLLASLSEERACVWQWDCTASDAVTALVYVGCFRVPEEKLPSSQEHNQHNPLLSHTWLSFLEKPNIWNEMKQCIVFYSFEWRGTELPFIQI